MGEYDLSTQPDGRQFALDGELSDVVTIETEVEINGQNEMRVTLPSGVPQGVHKVVIILDEIPANQTGTTPQRVLDLKPWAWENQPARSTFRREEIYGDDAR